MDTQQVSAHSRAPSSGVVHINIRLTDGYTIISNRLSQHRGLSLLAIGLGTHIQSLPAGRRIGIKVLAATFPESEAAIAAGLRELEHHGFLRRTRERVGGGRVATRTESYNHPEAATRRAVPTPVRHREPVPVREHGPVPVREHGPVLAPEPGPEPVRGPDAEPVQEKRDPAPAPRLVPPPTAPKPPPPALPGPCRPSEALYAAAADLLAGLRRTAPVFVLSEDDVRRLVPGVAAWLERGMRPDAVREVLTDDPPVPLRHPAKLLRHRLTAKLPPPLPVAAPVVPLQTCEDCDRAFRSSAPGVCRGCGDVRAGGAEGLLLSA
ncbi:hypothetical protein PUR33_17470 [Streptomyces sp. BE282]|uniref:Helix-turn-helix domain-containing protein n=1 Tax=Streptomyces microflavus TaxID=1919 RepID=A0A6N9VDN3_STRMI|nr:MULTISPECIES: hypothetical protein [Streptomyces]MEE1730901.1 hypothetical protein [Streptomyces sp. BE282]NEB69388.1 hypothetical protein [Streptomyces microflavus]